MKLEIEVKPAPAGYRYTGELRSAAHGEHYEYEGEAHKSVGECGTYLILERIKPKREIRWLNVYRETAYDTLKHANEGAGTHRKGCLRLDYEDGKLVAVTLEPEGEVRDE